LVTVLLNPKLSIMKKIMCFLYIYIFGHSFAKSQIIQVTRLVPAQSDIQYVQSKNGGNSTLIEEIKINVEYWTKPATAAIPGVAAPVNVPLTFIVNNESAGAAPFVPLAVSFINPPMGGYIIEGNRFKAEHDTTSFTLHIPINLTTAFIQTEFFDIQMAAIGTAYAPGDPSFRVFIKNTKDNVLSIPKDSTPTGTSVTYLNAVNFDFNSKLSPSYIGVFNVFAPSTKLPINKRWGIITGIEKINYNNANFNKDSSQVEFYHQNVLLNPLNFSSDTAQTGSKYLRQYNKFTYSSTNALWSFYVEPTYRLTKFVKARPKDGIYAHLHFELLINHYTRTANIQNIAQDTQVVSNSTQTHSQYNLVQANQIVSNYDFPSFCTGAGFTFYTTLQRDTTIHLFFQPTFGVISNSPNFDSLNSVKYPPLPNGDVSNTTIVNNKIKPFYLFKAGFIDQLSSKSELIIGFVVRVQIPTTNPQYAAYVGLNLDLNSVASLITGKQETN
jgi:hypothetical protein